MKCAAITSLCWITIAAIAYTWALTSQAIIIPNQTGYMEVRHNDLITTPSAFNVTERNQRALDQLVHDVTQ